MYSTCAKKKERERERKGKGKIEKSGEESFFFQ